MSSRALGPGWQAQLPVDLQQLISFICTDPLVLALSHSAGNNFLTCSPPGQSKSIRTALEAGNGKTCWGLLPVEWRTYFDSVEVGTRDAVLRLLSVGSAEAEFPASLTKFLSTCTSLSLDRTCSSHPVLSSLPPSQAIPPRPDFTPAASVARGLNNAENAGLSPKKHHEVVNFACLAADVLSDKRVRHAVDVGSGRAHLSRALARSPLDLHVLAVDWSASQTAGATRLDLITANAKASSTASSGSLTHTTNSLDAPSIERTLASWPAPLDPSNEPPVDAVEPSLLVALHACGNLTPDALHAFAADAAAHPSSPPRRMIAVGCCYNLLTPSTFPMSALVCSYPTATLDRDQLRISPQSPPTWHLSPASTKAWKTSILKLVHRARLEVELENVGQGEGRNEEKRVGRLPDLKTWPEYRRRALAKFGAPEDVPKLELEEEWDDILWKFSVFWTLRCWVGPMIETLLALDRWAFLVESLPEERRVELVNLFEQSTGSLRNLALVVRP